MRRPILLALLIGALVGGVTGPAAAAVGVNGKIVFVRGGTMYSANNNGTGAVSLGTNGANPEFSPDGSKIAFD